MIEEYMIEYTHTNTYVYIYMYKTLWIITGYV